ncbi:Nphp3 [Symbiodinium natans]|uniref:Nphp3 protein n=1 Tax=Symbiodinium natans TaxID=878477 RepID=A0A812H2J3_9DINO|nr:Nphp3 [Symbiodinium natans]
MQASEEEDPAWARAIRILESVPVSQGQRRQEPPQQPSRAPQPLPTAGSSRSATGRDSGDPGQPIRLQSYQRLLMDGAALPAEPGASLPLRFSGRAQVSAPTSPRREAGSLPSPGRAPEAARAASAGGPGPKQSAKGPSPAAAPRGEAVGTGRGHLVAALPSATGEMEEAELRKEDFVWSEHEFNDGEKENRRVLREFTKEFKRMAEATPDGVRDPKLLTAALDLALACVKCYELDKADAIYRRVLGECRRRGMPWDVKCLQDLATLRCKQHRQADAAELLEELAAKAPPHPATFINLGTVYNQLRQYDRAETWFQQAVNLKGGAPDKEDIWNLAICKKNMGRYDEALPMLQQALSAFQEQEPDQPVTIAKLHSSLGGCLHDMGRHSEAAEEYQKAHGLYAATVGRSSPLFCGAAEGLAKALLKERQHDRAFQALREAFEVHARCDSVHPTPLFECLEMAMDIHDQSPGVDLASLRSPIEDAMRNLESRGQDKDGNAGLVMSRAGKLLLRAGGAREEAYALQLLRRGRPLIQEAHDAEEANLAHELLEVDLLVQKSTSSAAEKPELQGSGLAL